LQGPFRAGVGIIPKSSTVRAKTFTPVVFFILNFILFILVIFNAGHAVAQLVEALCYKMEARGFDSR
jgi:hypothetical protein